MRVFVVGAGIISALGAGVEENFRALLAMRHGLTAKSGALSHELPDFPIGAVAQSNRELENRLEVRTSIPRTSLLSLHALREALQPLQGIQHLRMGFISATTVGGMDRSETFFSHYIPNDGRQQLRDIMYHPCGAATQQTARLAGRFHYVSTINTACSSSANAIMLGARKIKQGQLDVVTAGGTDALCSYTINGFNALLILDTACCRPFDRSRAGLNLGEGAGYLTLVSEKILRQHQLTPLCELVGYANANDAFHATASSDNGEGACLSMTRALQSAGLAPAQIDYINLHGTGTQNNDHAEAVAIRRIYNDQYPALSSTKSYTGHTLGAAGGIEAVFSCLAIRNNVVFPNLRWEQPMDGTGIVPATAVLHQPVRHVLSNSFGFGGNCSSLVFKKTEE